MNQTTRACLSVLEAQGARALGALPSPLWGGVGGGDSAILSQVAPPLSRRITPLPNPPPQGGREQTEFAARADSISHERALATARPSRAPLYETNSRRQARRVKAL